MNAASIVVGQYYMSLIDGELKAIRGVLQELLDLQLDEYRGAIQALIDQVNKMTDHQAEVLLNDELRGRVLSALDACERDCARLLEQAGQALTRLTRSRTASYPAYEQQIRTAAEWHAYQRILLDLQYQIGCLAYTLMFGTASPEFCFSSYSAGLSRARTACDALCAWHDAQIGRFGIDLHAGTRRRQGVDALLHTIPRLIDRQHEQRPIGESTALLLRTQMHPPADRLTAFESKFEQSTRLLFDGETLYYLND